MTNDDLLGIVDDLNTMDPEVDEYEADFLESAQDTLEAGKDLTTTQRDFLLKMKEKYL